MVIDHGVHVQSNTPTRKHTGVIVGIVIAVVFALALTFSGFVVWHRQRQGRPTFLTRHNKGGPPTPPNGNTTLQELDSTGCKTESCDVVSDSGQHSLAGIDSSSSQRAVAIGVTVVTAGQHQEQDHVLVPSGSHELFETGGSGSMVSSLASEMQHALSTAEYNYLVPPQDVQQLKQVLQ